MSCVITFPFACFARLLYTSPKEPTHTHLDECFAGLHFSLVVFAQTSTAREPTKSSLHGPPVRLNAEATRTQRAFHDFQFPLPLGFAPSGEVLSAVSCICPDFFEAGHEERESCEEAPGSSAVMHISRGDIDGDGDAQRIYEKMSLSASERLLG